MKRRNVKQILLLGTALGLGGLPVVSHAQTTVDCTGSILPANLCNTVSGIFGSGFTITSFIGIIIGLVIAVAVIFILFQVVKAILEWLGKSNDDKARAAAIKSITNAVIAGVVLVIALIIFAILLPAIANVPAAGYGCYKNVTGLTFTTEGTLKGASEISGVAPYDGTPGTDNNSASYNATSGVGATFKSLPDDLQNTLSKKIVCKVRDTGSEYTPNYIVAKTVGIKRTNP